MAMVRCNECNKKISDQAVSCPKCGCPVSSPQKASLEGKEYFCPYCFEKTPAEPNCKNCKRPIDTTRIKADYIGMMPKTTWEMPRATVPSSPAPEPKQKEKKAKIPWFAAGMAANQLRDAQIRGKNKEHEQSKQGKMLEETLKELKKRK
jgi:hypothetical protein